MRYTLKTETNNANGKKARVYVTRQNGNKAVKSAVNKRSRGYSEKRLIQDENALKTANAYSAMHDAIGAVKKLSTRYGILYYVYNPETKKVICRFENSSKRSKWMDTFPAIGSYWNRQFSYRGHIFVI